MDDYEIKITKDATGIIISITDTTNGKEMQFLTDDIKTPLKIFKDIQAFIAEITAG